MLVNIMKENCSRIVDLWVIDNGLILIFFFVLLCVFYFIYLFIYLWLRWVFVAACGLFSSCGKWRLLFVVVCGLLTAVASLVAEHGL